MGEILRGNAKIGFATVFRTSIGGNVLEREATPQQTMKLGRQNPVAGIVVVG